MTPEDEEFNRIEREASLRKAAVRATVRRPAHDDDDIQDYVRPWVGLTDKEMLILEETITCTKDESWLRNLTRAIESKLREKNT